MNYIDFIKELDIKLNKYFELHKEYICCKKGCSSCCELGDYPVSQIELEYIMQGYIALPNETKQIIQKNIKNMKRGLACPFLLNKTCSIYPYRPIICRTHGLAYLCKDTTVKLPYCSKEGKNYNSVYINGEFLLEPIKENLDTNVILGDTLSQNVKNLYDWLRPE